MESKCSRCSCVLSGYDRFARVMDRLQSLLLLLIRVYIGWQCILSGYGHFTHFQQTVDAFRGWHVPLAPVSVALSATTELVGGALLLVGLGARLVSIPLLINFLVAMIQTDLADPRTRDQLKHLWDNQDIILKDTVFPFFAASVLILFFGPGWFSIDGIVRFIRRRRLARARTAVIPPPGPSISPPQSNPPAL